MLGLTWEAIDLDSGAGDRAAAAAGGLRTALVRDQDRSLGLVSAQISSPACWRLGDCCRRSAAMPGSPGGASPVARRSCSPDSTERRSTPARSTGPLPLAVRRPGARNVNVHDARRTRATLLVDFDVHPRAIMWVLRHTNCCHDGGLCQGILECHEGCASSAGGGVGLMSRLATAVLRSRARG